MNSPRGPCKVICVSRLLAVIAALVAGCYQDPDYGGTHFKCDASHACPGSQVCVNGSCAAGVGGGPDGGVTGGNGVLCGTSTCTAGQQCCAEFSGGLSCAPTGTSCIAGFAATCDGIEDCGGLACCMDGADRAPASCSTMAACRSLPDQLCRDAMDCTDPQARQCCFGVGSLNEPWGRCLPGC